MINDDVLNKRYLVRTHHYNTFDDNISETLGSPISTINGRMVNDYDDVLVDIKLTVKKIIQLYKIGAYMVVHPKKRVLELAADIKYLLDRHYSKISYNDVVVRVEIEESGATVNELKQFYSNLLSKNKHIVEYAYNKPRDSAFGLGFTDELNTARVSRDVRTKEIIKREMDSSNFLTGYRLKGRT